MSIHNLPSPACGGGQGGGRTLIPMARPQIGPHGSWRSPVTADAIVSGVIGLSQIQLDGDDIYWVEGRPAEAGRNVIVRRRPDGSITDITPREYNVRTRVHEYGGGAYLVRDGVVWFTNFEDQRLYRQDPRHPPVAITPAEDIRHADLVFDPRHQRLIAIREDHTTDMPQAVNTIVSLDPTGKTPARTLVQANDFYSSPRVSPSGTHLAWTTWNHPNMPWDGTELWVAQLAPDGGVADARLVAGGPDESVFQPEWSPAGVLHFVSDRTGWWNLYRERSGAVEDLMPMEADFGFPQWLLDESSFAFVDEESIACSYVREGQHRLALLHVRDGHMEDLDVPCTHLGLTLEAEGTTLYFVGASSTQPPAAIALDLATGREEVLRRSLEVELDPGYLSVARPTSFPHGGGMSARGLAIRGGSAGGYTTLCAITFRDEFAAGASYYGIGDLETMVRDTHKFESRYLDRLVGPYPEAIDVYRERSPVHHVERISTPVIMFQGMEDAVVPPNQAEDMARALRARGVPFAYLAFEGEQHGFRKAETNRRCLEAELYFYSRVLGFDLPDT